MKINRKNIKLAYQGLFTLLILAVNPFGGNLNNIYVIPKICILILIIYLNFLMGCKLNINWRWSLFLGLGLISSIISPMPLISFFGQTEMGDGWFFWILISIFTSSQSKIKNKNIWEWQKKGILTGIIILSLCSFLNQKLFYSHPGHTALVIFLGSEIFSDYKKYKWVFLIALINTKKRAMITAYFMLRKQKVIE